MSRLARLLPASTASIVCRLAGLATIALVQSYWFMQPAPLMFKGLAALAIVLSVARPSIGLLVFAGLAPLSTPIANLYGAYGMGAQLIEQSALGIGAGVLLRSGSTGGETRIGAPALFMALVAVSSAVSMMPAAAAPVVRSFWNGSLLQQLATRQTALSSPVWAPMFAVLVIAECSLLGWAVERTVRREPRLATRLILMGLIGQAGAAVMDLQDVLGAALRTGAVLKALPSLLTTVRISLQMDVHAAASALLLAGVAGFGLMNKSPARRAGVGLLIVLIAAGLWIGGSRVAIVLGAVTAIGALGWSAVRAGGWRLVIAGAVVLAIGAGAWMATLYPGRYNTTSGSMDSRLIMAKVGIKLFRQAPVFGIGITKFYGASAAYLGPDEARIVAYTRENAHNNFVQVAAEQGLVGLGAMLWWLGMLLVTGARAQAASPNAFRGALLLAVVACVGTWMAGHPLLVPEFAFVFWLYSGILTAMTPQPSATRPRWFLWILVASLVVSITPRAYEIRNSDYLEHLGFGLSSLWQHDDKQRYREAGASFAIYLPATGRPVDVPMRRAPGAPDPLLVDVWIGGRLIETVSVGSDAWQTVSLLLPTGPRQFDLVEFAVRPATDSSSSKVLLRVGRDTAR